MNNLNLREQFSKISSSWNNVQSKIVAYMNKESILNDKILYHTSTSGYVENPQKVLEILESRYRLINCHIEKDNLGARFYLIKDNSGFVEFSEYDEGYFQVEVRALDLEEVSKIMLILRPMFSEIEPTGTVKMLAESKNGFNTIDIGQLKTPLNRANYSPKVLEQYDHLKEEMSSSTPCGRFSILRGEPGTGKSYFIRGLISEVPKVRWLFIPSYMVGRLSGPAMGQVLFQNSEDTSTPLALILEDADSSIATRDASNKDSMSDLLNLGDGILGELADIRMITTTNAKTQQIDPALLRVGRLCQSVDFELLDRSTWELRWKDLTATEFEDTLPVDRSLANLYRMARDAGWKGNKEDKVIRSVKRVKAAPALKEGLYI